MRRLRAFVPGLILCWLAWPAAGRDVVDIAPHRFASGESSPPPQAAPGGGVAFALPFSADRDRFYWDVSLRPLPPAAALEVDVSCDDPAAVRALSIHLQTGGAWVSAQQVLTAPDRQTLLFRRSDFDADPWSPTASSPPTALRLSVWKGASRDARLVLHGIRTRAFTIAVAQGSEAHTAPGEAALAEQCAARALQLLDKAGLPAELVADDFEHLDLRPYRLLILPYNPRLSARQVAVLERFVKKRKGLLAVFYNANPDLAALLGLQAPVYATMPVDWTTVSFQADSLPGLPPAMSHRTRHLLPARAKAKTAIELGVWLDPNNPSGDPWPASAVSSAGLWFSHVPPFASPAAVQWLLAALARADRAYARDRDRFRADLDRRDAQAAEILRPPPAPGEIRAVWAHPITARSRPAVFRQLATNGIHAVFEHLATAGVLLDGAREKPLAAALAEARAAGIQLHAWCIAWSLYDLPADQIAPLRAQNRLMQDSNGNELPWLCPAHPENRQLLIEAGTDLARRGVAGIHLDYIRYPARAGCYCPRHRFAFESTTTAFHLNWPADVLPGAPLAAEFDQFRQDEMASFVAELAAAVRAVNPAIQISAAVFPLPEAVAQYGQDWPAWLRAGHLDFAAPMLYESLAARFADRLDLCLAAAPAPGKILPGIGSTADQTQLDARGMAEQIQVARNRQTAGFAFFHLDAQLEQFLPLFAR